MKNKYSLEEFKAYTAVYLTTMHDKSFANAAAHVKLHDKEVETFFNKKENPLTAAHEIIKLTKGILT